MPLAVPSIWDNNMAKMIGSINEALKNILGRLPL